MNIMTLTGFLLMHSRHSAMYTGKTYQTTKPQTNATMLCLLATF